MKEKMNIVLLKERHPDSYRAMQHAIDRLDKYELFAMAYMDEMPGIGISSIKNHRLLIKNQIENYIEKSTSVSGFELGTFEGYAHLAEHHYVNFFQKLRRTRLKEVSEVVHPQRIISALQRCLDSRRQELSELKRLPDQLHAPGIIEKILRMNEQWEYPRAVLYTVMYGNYISKDIPVDTIIAIVNLTLEEWEEVFVDGEIRFTKNTDTGLLLEAFRDKIREMDPKGFRFPMDVINSFDEVLLAMDDYFGVDIDLRKDFIKATKELCSNRKYELKKANVPKSFRLDKETVRYMDALSKRHELDNTKLIKMLIHLEYENGGSLG